MRYGAFLQIFREIREGMEGKGGKWEFSGAESAMCQYANVLMPCGMRTRKRKHSAAPLAHWHISTLNYHLV